MERWDLFEISLKGKTDGNPFRDHFIRGTFISESEEKTVDGFYDGNGVYIVRFMPSYEGEYRYRIFGSFSDTKYEGIFLAEKPSGINHGVVRVKDTRHFCYDDGTPFFRWEPPAMCGTCFSAYRNIWWALANEYDMISAKSLDNWERYGSFLAGNDPYRHLISIHNCFGLYDHSKKWITHCSIQRQDLYKTSELTNEWRARYLKPIVLDEIAYEGNIQYGWGNITGKELIRRFWEAVCRGGYLGHGETFLGGDNILWWSHGGALKGESSKRVEFLKEILSKLPASNLKYGNSPSEWDCVCGISEDDKIFAETRLRLYYFSFMRPCFRDFYFDDDTEYQVDIIDTWGMTVHDAGIHKGKFRIALPCKAYMAVKIQKNKIRV